MKKIIVSRHPATIEFIARYLDGKVEGEGNEMGVRVSDGEFVPVIGPEGTGDGKGNARPQDIAGMVVLGNLPLHLASLANVVYAVEFMGPAPRGQEYTADDMAKAGARLMPYKVRSAQ